MWKLVTPVLGKVVSNCGRALVFLVEQFKGRKMRELLEEEKAQDNVLRALGVVERMIKMRDRLNLTPSERQEFSFLITSYLEILASMRAFEEVKKISSYSHLRVPLAMSGIYLAGKYFSRKFITA